MSGVVVLAGGVGGSKFTLGVRAALATLGEPEATVIVNTGDDIWLSGVRLQPDVDSMIYALAGANDTERGWGRAGDTERVNTELQAWGTGWPWFTLGDLDLGTHIARTGWLRDGLSPTEVLERLSKRWPLGAKLLPMTDDEVDTHVLLKNGERLHFQEWWTRYRAQLPPAGFENPGIAGSFAAPGVVEAIEDADLVLIAPSNPVVSIGPILAVPEIREALRATGGPVIGVSPIIGGNVVRGMADVCLGAVGVRTAADAVAAHYGARLDGGVLDTWLIAEEDAELAASVEALGISVDVVPLWMRDAETAEALAVAAISAGR
ncbi:LPPG:FO 2-phospho-L-lactate transferase [Microbacterium halimionae]|uniref:LPPG:FO 2-phospho-L-lactate transferase n=1 Tax=Microbacterium halimionae TaxID=1526413 RepID=A0A7W3JLL2_9MICO|nr:2-phospho-L-lactate transferase [Microbacterium halimionae]MBA8815063.1 LPPG:FO 2-phospho-L-lactate transferase [Microbacterium halimionae]NII94146.1 LPPG:FO 2-phospho-L-lactate transferase [Microbacterium halimionae]